MYVIQKTISSLKYDAPSIDCVSIFFAWEFVRLQIIAENRCNGWNMGHAGSDEGAKGKQFGVQRSVASYSWIAHQMDIGTLLRGRHTLVQLQI